MKVIIKLFLISQPLENKTVYKIKILQVLKQLKAYLLITYEPGSGQILNFSLEVLKIGENKEKVVLLREMILV